ncbi:MAG: hypothetical protein EAZ30_02450 [Betaproteobacteria bacterium]|nr:MAG: hypothetical protein EAZ30_02450 [Betaproteobacteria bacterium]
MDVSQRNDSGTHIKKHVLAQAASRHNGCLQLATAHYNRRAHFHLKSLSNAITSARRRLLSNGSMQSFFRSRGQFFWVILTLCFCLGAYLRLHNVGSQVLVGDEWHLVHRLTYYPLSESMRTFGYADFGIPLAVLFTPIMNWVGLSETTLRVPMLLAGIASVVIIPVVFRPRFDDRVLAILSLLIAVSPFLISYARIARTYALTALGVYVAFWCLQRATEAVTRGEKLRWRPAVSYAVLAALIVWTHPIVGPVMVTPFAFLLWRSIRGVGPKLWQVIALGALTAILMAVLLLPPLLNDMKALSAKSAIDSIEWQTLVGAAHLWFGTDSGLIVVVALCMMALGLPIVWARSDIARWVLAGSALTVAALLLARPWWINMPLAFARYLLPLLPVLLLAVAVGLVWCCDRFLRMSAGLARSVVPALVTLVSLGLWWPTSPHPETLRIPNSFTQDLWFQLDYRIEKNVVRNAVKTAPISKLWAGFATELVGSKTIAVAPFHYATFDWPVAMWESTSGQRVIPAYLWGSCVETRHGEVPRDSRFKFNSAAYVAAGKQGLAAQGVDYLVYQIVQQINDVNPPLPQCEAWVRQNFGPPDVEDGSVLIWKLR